ncbi:hypothetical protein [Corynebacterium sp. A21]|uniref:hypothetical protein n=1 Tax=Corynebacterium sp. A21 TaxID=3457318 RepID=UPI003FCF683B
MTQQESVDQINEMMKDHKATSKLIKEERKIIATEAESFGQQILDARRELGIPDPDGKEWGQRMVQFQIGLRALAMGMQEPDFTIDGVPDSLRLWLTNPMTDTPASNEDLGMYIEMLAEHEMKAAA